MMVRIRCKRCGDKVDHLDILQHGIEVHNDSEAKYILEKMESVRKEFGLKRLNINDVFTYGAMIDLIFK